MNLILLDELVETWLLKRGDPRYRHVVEVLRCEKGGSFDVGVVDGPRGRAVVTDMDEAGCHVRLKWGELPTPLFPCSLWVGMPRPTAARRILREVASIGIARICFFVGEKDCGSYASSSLWTSGEWQGHLRAGAEGAFHTRLPEVRVLGSLEELITRSSSETDQRVAMDIYEASETFHSVLHGETGPLTLAIGPERGWNASERTLLRSNGFQFAHMGERVLRVDSACIAALGAIATMRGWWDRSWKASDRIQI